MKAIVRTQYGSPEVLQFAEVATPTPADNEVMIKLCAASVNPLDLFLMKGAPWNRVIPGLRTPKHKVLGCDIAGRVEAVGRNVRQFQPGDEVFGVTGFEGKGFAEYVCAIEEKLGPKPANLSFEDAAAVPIAASTKAFGAEVTAVCSTRNLDTARSIGADHVIDYTQVDFARSGQRYDLILAANAHHSIFDYRRALSQDGIYIAAGGGVVRILQALFLGPLLSLGRKKMGFFLANINQKDLVFLKDLLEAGEVAPVIDRRYPLSEAAEALRYLAEGHARGKVVLTVQPSIGT